MTMSSTQEGHGTALASREAGGRGRAGLSDLVDARLKWERREKCVVRLAKGVEQALGLVTSGIESKTKESGAFGFFQVSLKLGLDVEVHSSSYMVSTQEGYVFPLLVELKGLILSHARASREVLLTWMPSISMSWSP